MLNQSERCNYNPNLVWINQIPDQFLCVQSDYLPATADWSGPDCHCGPSRTVSGPSPRESCSSGNPARMTCNSGRRGSDPVRTGRAAATSGSALPPCWLGLHCSVAAPTARRFVCWGNPCGVAWDYGGVRWVLVKFTNKVFFLSSKKLWQKNLLWSKYYCYRMGKWYIYIWTWYEFLQCENI